MTACYGVFYKNSMNDNWHGPYRPETFTYSSVKAAKSDLPFVKRMLKKKELQIRKASWFETVKG